MSLFITLDFKKKCLRLIKFGVFNVPNGVQNGDAIGSISSSRFKTKNNVFAGSSAPD